MVHFVSYVILLMLAITVHSRVCNIIFSQSASDECLSDVVQFSDVLSSLECVIALCIMKIVRAVANTTELTRWQRHCMSALVIDDAIDACNEQSSRLGGVLSCVCRCLRFHWSLSC